MNILLISQLYPAYPGQSSGEVSYALHYLARKWIPGENVLIVRPYLVPDLRKKNRNIVRGIFYLDGVKILVFPFLKIPKFRLFYFGPLYKELKRMGFSPDVVIAHMGFSLFFGYKISRYFDVPLLSAVHSGDLVHGSKMLTPERLKKIYHHSVGIACRSFSLHNEFLKRYPGLQERCFVAYSGIPEKLIEEKAFALSKLQQWKGEKGKKVRILTVGSLIKRRNIEITLFVLSRLAREIDWVFTIIGQGEERQNLEKLVQTLRMGHRVRFLGFLSREEVIEEMKRSHIFILISFHETFGLAYLEAMAAGNIIIGSKGTGIDGLIENGKQGFLCTPRDEKEILETIENIITRSSKKELQQILGRAYQILADYTEEKAAENYLKNIYRVCKK